MSEAPAWVYSPACAGFAVYTDPDLGGVAGFVVYTDHDQQGARFNAFGSEWEVVRNMKTPCHAYPVSLVRKVGSGLCTWIGVACECGQTYTFEVLS